MIYIIIIIIIMYSWQRLYVFCYSDIENIYCFTQLLQKVRLFVHEITQNNQQIDPWEQIPV